MNEWENEFRSNEILKIHPELYYLAVVKKNEIVFERWYKEYSYSTYMLYVKSVSKILFALAMGIVLNENDFINLETPIREILDCNSKATIRDILEMRAGVQWNESGHELSEWLHSKNWINSYLQKEDEKLLGEKFFYASPNAYIISVIISKLTGKRAYRYIYENIFRPLEIHNFFLQVNPEGYDYGGGDLFIAPSDLVKILLMLLNQGKINCTQIIPSEWIEQCFMEHARISNSLIYGFFAFGIKCNNAQTIWTIPGSGGQYMMYYPDHEIGIIVSSVWNEKYANLDPLKLPVFRWLIRKIL